MFREAVRAWLGVVLLWLALACLKLRMRGATVALWRLAYRVTGRAVR